MARKSRKAKKVEQSSAEVVVIAEEISSVRDETYRRVYAWKNCIIDESIFPKVMLKHFGIRAKFLDYAITNPTVDHLGKIVEGSGGRKDVLFVVHTNDIARFEIPRRDALIHTLDEMLSTEFRFLIYPEEIYKYSSIDNPIEKTRQLQEVKQRKLDAQIQVDLANIKDENLRLDEELRKTGY